MITRCSSMSLIKLLFVFAQKQWAYRDWGAPTASKMSPCRSIGQVFFSTNDGTNTHGSIIDSNTKIIHWNTTQSQQNKITEGTFGIPRDCSTDYIIYKQNKSRINIILISQCMRFIVSLLPHTSQQIMSYGIHRYVILVDLFYNSAVKQAYSTNIIV